MERIIKIGMIAFITIALSIVLGIFIKKRIDIINEARQDELENQAMLDLAREMIPKYKKYEVIEIALKKNQDWSDFLEYFTDDFRKKYNEKDGILGKIEVEDAYRDITYVPQEIDYMDTETPVYIVKSNGKRYRYYFKIIFNEWHQIDDLEIIDIVDLDSKDEEVINGVRFTEDTTERLLYNMIFAYDGEAGLSKHFREKYPNFDGLFDRKGLPIKYVLFNGKTRSNYTVSFRNCDYNNRVIEGLKIEDLYRGFRYIYNMYFMLDSNYYLDDYSFEFVSKENNPNINSKYYLYNNPTSGEITKFLSISGHDWSTLPITYGFREKYNENDGIFPNLEIDWVEFVCKPQDVTKYPICLHLQDGSIKYYGLIFKLTDTNLIDDIERIELNVDSNKKYTVEELMALF